MFLLPQSCLHQGLGIVDPNTAGANGADGLQSFGSPNRTEAALTRGAAGVVYQARHAAQIFSGRADSHHSRPLGCLVSFFAG